MHQLGEPVTRSGRSGYTKVTRGRRAANGAIGMFVPRDAIRERCARYMSQKKPALRGPILHDENHTIVAKAAPRQ